MATLLNVAEVNEAKAAVKIAPRLQSHHEARARWIQVVEVFLKNQHLPRLLSLGDTAETCRFFRGSVAPRLTSDAKSSKKASWREDRQDTGAGTSAWRLNMLPTHLKKKKHIQTRQAVATRRFHLRLCG